MLARILFFTSVSFIAQSVNASPILVYKFENLRAEVGVVTERSCGVFEDKIITKTMIHGRTLAKETPISWNDGQVEELRSLIKAVSEVAPVVSRNREQKFTSFLTGIWIDEAGNDHDVVIRQSVSLDHQSRPGQDALILLETTEEVCRLAAFPMELVF